jgi:predicted kinase
VNDNKIDLLKILHNQVKNCKEAGKNVAIANTNLTRKSRKALVNSLGKANYICLYVYAPTKIILMRNMLRNSKQIPELVIKRFMRNQQIPTLKEGFDDVIFIRNY